MALTHLIVPIVPIEDSRRNSRKIPTLLVTAPCNRGDLAADVLFPLPYLGYTPIIPFFLGCVGLAAGAPEGFQRQIYVLDQYIETYQHHLNLTKEFHERSKHLLSEDEN